MNKGVRDTHLCGNSSNAEAAWICFRSPVFYTKNGKLKFLPAYLKSLVDEVSRICRTSDVVAPPPTMADQSSASVATLSSVRLLRETRIRCCSSHHVFYGALGYNFFS